MTEFDEFLAIYKKLKIDGYFLEAKELKKRISKTKNNLQIKDILREYRQKYKKRYGVVL